MPKAKPPYAAELRQHLLELARLGSTPAQLSREFGVSTRTITEWCAVAGVVHGEDLIPVLVTRDRSVATADFLLEAVSKDCLNQVLKLRVNVAAVHCTESSAAQAGVNKELQVHNENMNQRPGECVRGTCHTRSANVYHCRLKG